MLSTPGLVRSVRPPNPVTSRIVRPCVPNAASAFLISSSLNCGMTASIVFHEALAMVALGGNRYELRIRCFTLTGFFAVPRATDKATMMSLRLMMPRR